MSKKDKKDKKLFGMIDLNDPMMIGVVVVLFLLCVYLGLVYILQYDYNPLNWFNGSSTTPEVANTTSAPLSGPVELKPASDDPLNPTNPIEQFKGQQAEMPGLPPVSGGKLLKKLRRR